MQQNQNLNEEVLSEAEFKSEPAEQSKPSKFLSLKNYFTATRMAYMGVFTAISFVLYFLEIPIFAAIPAVSFLKIDFSNTMVMISGFALGPVAAVIVAVLKEILHALILSQTIGVGELANILLTLPYVLIPSIIYKKRKGIKTVLISLAIACVVQTAISVPVNYLLTFPFFLNLFEKTPWLEGMKFYLEVWYFAVLFNIIKTLIISVSTLILYKPLSKLIKYTNAKFEAIKNKKQAN